MNLLEGKALSIIINVCFDVQLKRNENYCSFSQSFGNRATASRELIWPNTSLHSNSHGGDKHMYM